ncbi:hypothetical protein [Bradyrhizobium sp. ARR65]|uniref:hypothetical protein n=1 Tax=Bradyrhizobium sp. ARR65 TaxID=1040989 RepID=UPI000466A925|nr:hypothetical protein [Bradyrhizobium sp. ARR65]
MELTKLDFPAALHAQGPDPERAEALALYGRSNSFHWLGEAKPAGTSDWRLMVEVRAQRRLRG